MTPSFRRLRRACPVTGLLSAALACLAAAAPAVGQATQPPSGTSEENRRRLEAQAALVESEYVVGPKAADQGGYRVVWQTRIEPQGSAVLSRVAVRGDNVFAGDSRNGVARIKATDGDVMWRVAVANPVDIYRGLEVVTVPVPQPGSRTPRFEDRVLLSTDTECFVLDLANGTFAGRQRFAKLPSTPPILAGNFLVYGTIGGQVVWHQFVVGHEWRANSLGGVIRAGLRSLGRSIIAASDNGTVMALDDTTARRRWARNTFGGVIATPAVNDDTVFVASLDQYLWAFDARSGATLWRYFTQSPLKTPPFAFRDMVLQFIPTEGVVCFSARPEGQIEGQVRWKNADLRGIPLGAINDAIALWDDEAKTLTIVHPEDGRVRAAVALPQVKQFLLVNDGPLAGNIFVTSADGRIVRLAPKSPTPPPAVASAPAKAQGPALAPPDAVPVAQPGAAGSP
jgi:outer membrane protein assembly factor BamB